MDLPHVTATTSSRSSLSLEELKGILGHVRPLPWAHSIGHYSLIETECLDPGRPLAVMETYVFVSPRFIWDFYAMPWGEFPPSRNEAAAILAYLVKRDAEEKSGAGGSV
jgi:hypothetical protein